MARTTPELVAAVMAPGHEYDPAIDLTPFINQASYLVNRVALIAPVRGYVYDFDALQTIETELAAHFYLTSDKVYQSKSDGGASASFMQETGKGFEQTPHGQTALRLDYSGVLNGIDKMARARIINVGGGCPRW